MTDKIRRSPPRSRTGPESERVRAYAKQTVLGVGEQIQTLRMRLGMTQTAFALAIGSTANSVGRLEAGKTTRGPTVDRLARMAAALGVEIDIRFTSNPRKRGRSPARSKPAGRNA